MRSDIKLGELTSALERNFGDIHAAARQVGVSPYFVLQWIKDDEVARNAIEEAQRVGYMGIESVALERAIKGSERGVWHAGQRVGVEIQHHDGLLTKILEARVPAYNKSEGGPGGKNVFNGPVQINNMPRAENYEEWVAMRNLTLEQRNPLALEAPKVDVPEILQGEYVEIEKATPDRPLAALEGLL